MPAAERSEPESQSASASASQQPGGVRSARGARYAEEDVHRGLVLRALGGVRNTADLAAGSRSPSPAYGGIIVLPNCDGLLT